MTRKLIMLLLLRTTGENPAQRPVALLENPDEIDTVEQGPHCARCWRLSSHQRSQGGAATHAFDEF